MKIKTKDADTEWTVAGAHGLLTLVESLISSRRMYILPRHFTASVISLHIHASNFIVFSQAQNRTGESEHQEI